MFDLRSPWGRARITSTMALCPSKLKQILLPYSPSKSSKPIRLLKQIHKFYRISTQLRSHKIWNTIRTKSSQRIYFPRLEIFKKEGIIIVKVDNVVFEIRNIPWQSRFNEPVWTPNSQYISKLFQKPKGHTNRRISLSICVVCLVNVVENCPLHTFVLKLIHR